MQQHCRIDLSHCLFRQPAAKTAESRMIRRRLIEGKSEKLLERDTVIDLGFQFGIGFDMEPLLQQKALEQQQRRISACTFNAFTNGIMLQQQVFDRRPVNDGIYFSQSRNSAVTFHGIQKGINR